MKDKTATLSIDQAAGLVSALIEADRLADAEVTCREVLRLDPDDARFVYLLGRCAVRREDWPVALEHFRKAESMNQAKER